ncbi:MAG TPA: site-specific DNA-methyltransferase [Pseudonocardiaceae bacterium]|jgi:site-specific DNA-methyltransferase (adenine-specific)
MSAPYYSDEYVTLYHGDCRAVLPVLTTDGARPDAAVVDPPYGETSATWDRWPDGWVDAVGAALPASATLWCFGSARMFWDRRDDFAAWKFAQEQLWVKTKGSGPASRDRLAKVHEWAYQFYRGNWGALHHEWERVPHDGPNNGVKSKSLGTSHHTGGARERAWTDDGTRHPRSVTYIVESKPPYRGRPSEKPLVTIIPLVRECTPVGGLVLDCFAGSGTTGVAAKSIGRRAVLIEGDEAACEQAAIRFANDRCTLPGLLDGAAS